MTVVQNGEVYEITFKYDPNLVSLVKQVAGRRWNPTRKLWTIPRNKLGFLLNILNNTPYASSVHIESEEDINVNATLDVTAQIPDIDVSKIHFYIKEGARPYKHQLDFLKYAIDRQRRGLKSGFILGDDPGLGKTIQAANLAIYNKQLYNYKHCLIICCINSSKFNWVEDITEHTQGEYVPYILGTRLKRDKKTFRYDTGNKEKLQDLTTGHMYGDTLAPELPFFIVMNIEGLRAKEGKKYVITTELLKYINNNCINMIIIDEIHKNASPTSTQGKQLLNIHKLQQYPVLWLPVTGTPISNKPTDAYTPLKLVGAHSYKSYSNWCSEFCIYGGYGGYSIIGYKNIPKLKNMLQSNMLRRLKKDVLDLPPKMDIPVYVENTKYQAKLYDAVVQDMLHSKDIIMAELRPITKFLRLRQVNGCPEVVDTELKVDSKYIYKNAKIQCVLNILEEIHSRNEKVVVFSNWVSPLRTLYRFVSKLYNVCVFTGTMPDTDRLKNKQIFLSDPKYTILLGTVGAMGVSHTFTVASNVIFLDEPWNPTDKKQAEERVYRIGTHGSVNIYTVLTKDTVDDKVHKILYRKGTISDYIVDNKLDIKKDPNLFNYLLGR